MSPIKQTHLHGSDQPEAAGIPSFERWVAGTSRDCVALCLPCAIGILLCHKMLPPILSIQTYL